MMSFPLCERSAGELSGSSRSEQIRPESSGGQDVRDWRPGYPIPRWKRFVFLAQRRRERRGRSAQLYPLGARILDQQLLLRTSRACGRGKWVKDSKPAAARRFELFSGENRAAVFLSEACMVRENVPPQLSMAIGLRHASLARIFRTQVGLLVTPKDGCPANWEANAWACAEASHRMEANE